MTVNELIAELVALEASGLGETEVFIGYEARGCDYIESNFTITISENNEVVLSES